jgi:AcrR family transcriptional regulator
MVKKHKKRGRNSAQAASGRRSSFELLWGSRDKGSRGPKPALSLDAVIRAAIEVVDAEGLAALTMARVAADLDVTTMALYRYLPGKNELMELMSDSAMGLPPDKGGGEWRFEVARWARASLAMFLEQPWLLEMIARRTTVGPNWLAWLNAALDALSDSGLPAKEMIPAVLLIDSHVRSTAQLRTGAPATPQWAENFGRVLQSVHGNARYATLTRLVMSEGFGAPGEDGPIPFEFGLQRILDGIESFVAGQRQPRTEA